MLCCLEKNGSIFLNEDVIEIELREQWPPRIRFFVLNTNKNLQ